MIRKPLQWVLVGLCSVIFLECCIRFVDMPGREDVYFNWFFWDYELRRKGLIEDGGHRHGSYVLRINNLGFRDTKNWPPPVDSGIHRIVLGAAGHGFGENVSNGGIYAHLLQEELQKQSPKEIELYNLAVQGSTILFFERYLLDKVLETKPQVVVLSYGGFNEALYSHIPEKNVLFPDHHLHNFLMGSELLRTLRLFVASRNPKNNRVPLDEFIESYGRVIEALQQGGIQIVLLQQVVMYPDIPGLWVLADMKKYRDGLRSVAARSHVPLVDPLLYCPQVEECFHNREWYSRKGHEAVTQALLSQQERLLADSAK